MAAKRVAVQAKPRTFGLGLFAAGIIAVIVYNHTGDVPWWVLFILIPLSFLIDLLYYGSTRRKGVYIKDEV